MNIPSFLQKYTIILCSLEARVYSSVKCGKYKFFHCSAQQILIIGSGNCHILFHVNMWSMLQLLPFASHPYWTSKMCQKLMPPSRILLIWPSHNNHVYFENCRHTENITSLRFTTHKNLDIKIYNFAIQKLLLLWNQILAYIIVSILPLFFMCT